MSWAARAEEERCREGGIGRTRWSGPVCRGAQLIQLPRQLDQLEQLLIQQDQQLVQL